MTELSIQTRTAAKLFLVILFKWSKLITWILRKKSIKATTVNLSPFMWKKCDLSTSSYSHKTCGNLLKVHFVHTILLSAVKFLGNFIIHLPTNHKKTQQTTKPGQSTADEWRTLIITVRKLFVSPPLYLNVITGLELV